MFKIRHLLAWPIVSIIGFHPVSAQVSHQASLCDPSATDCRSRPVVVIEQPRGNVRVGHGDTVGEVRYPVRSMPAEGIYLVEFSDTPQVSVPLSNDAPPPLEALAGRPDLQEAFDSQAEPGQFVTPPSIAM